MIRRAGSVAAVSAMFAAAICARVAPARAQGLELEVIGARNIARAGAMTVSADGVTALLLTPAGLARRETLRFELGFTVQDDAVRFRDTNRAPRSPCDPALPPQRPPEIRDRSGPTGSPTIGGFGGIGRLVVGAAYAETGNFARNLTEPNFGGCPEDTERLYPHRYGGVATRYRHRVFAVGGAMRLLDWLGVGASATISAVSLSERRTIWAGFSGRDTIGDPRQDLALGLTGKDLFVPGFAASALIAPPELPIEFALSVRGAASASLSGGAALAATLPGSSATPVTSSPGSSTTLPSPLELRAGARYLGERLLVEVGAMASFYPTGAGRRNWAVTGIEVRDQTGVMATLAEVPTLVTRRRSGSVRAAVDYDVVPGFLWLSAGYSFRSGESRKRHFSPGFSDFATHTVSAGAEILWENVILSIGYARSFSPKTTVGDGTEVELINPFGAGTLPSGDGRYRSGTDILGLSIEASFPEEEPL